MKQERQIDKRGGGNRLSIDVLQARAIERGGKCLSVHYAGTNTEYEFQCKDGHKWKTRAQNLLQKNRWCPTCGKQFYDNHELKTFQTLALNKGGICLSESYGGLRERLTFMCAVGHIWSPIAASLLHRGSWCYFCSRESTLPASKNSSTVVAQMDVLCSSKGGRLVSRTYRGCDVQMVFECSHKHHWFSLVREVKNGNWCKVCSTQDSNAS
jgi:hypothetical protein